MKSPWKLKKTNIFVKLMKFTWGLEYKDFKWMCVFTWLSVFNVMVFPITILIKLAIKWIFRPINKLFDKLDDYLDKKAEQWANENLFKINTYGNSVNYDFSFLFNASKREREIYFNKVKLMNYDLWRRFYDAYDNAYDRKVINIIHKKQATREERVQKIFKIGAFFKPIATAILWLVGSIAVLFALFGIYKGIIALMHVSPHGWWSFAKVIIFLVVGIAIIILAIWGGSQLEEDKLFKARMARFGRILATPFVLLWKLISGLFILIKDTISDNCPAIEWED